MNGTTKQRYISTSIWDDDWFDSLTEREKLVYFYLLTNTHTNPAGVYQCTLKNVRLEIGLEREEIERIMAKFGAAGKAFYYKDYIIIPKWLKHQKINDRSKMFLGALKVLKSLPEDVKAFISIRKHYDYDISGIIGNVDTSSIDSLYLNNDTLSNNRDSLSENGSKTGIADPENAVQNPHDLDLDSDSDLDSDLDNNIPGSEVIYPPIENSEILSQHFISLWQHNADVFNCLSRLKEPKNWKRFWEQNTLSMEQINLAVKNFIDGIKSGAIERRFIPASPDAFVLNGWLQRSANPFKKQDSKISNDHVEDTTQYFTEE
jgi:hypothetical protein